MSKVISYSTLVRQQHLNFLKHKDREYREREDYLGGVRKLLFQVEGQMRQAEIQQLEVFREMAAHFKIPLNFPDLGDRVGLQDAFSPPTLSWWSCRNFLPAASPLRSAARKSWPCRKSPRRRDRQKDCAGQTHRRPRRKKITGRVGEEPGQSVKGENGI